MNRTLIVLGVGVWAVMLLLRFVLFGDIKTADPDNILLLNIIEIAAFIITVVGIIKKDF
ncbi:MAG: hypothetical protein JXA00_00835 [Candidatus Thermoplasmatota archaeon]|nr:hypothetical protein [Candidatus Thermoplasmatota archaeon]